MIKSLRDYITEAEQYVTRPAPGDELDIEIAPGDIVSTYVLESTADSITVYGDEQTFALLETIRRYGAVGSSPAMGHSIAEAVMKDIATQIGELIAADDYNAIYDLLTSSTPAGEMLQDMYNSVAQDYGLHPDDDQEQILDRLFDQIKDDFGGQDIDEAEYQGREVELNKPTRGGSKKFYVYVKDPKSGNTRKISFGDPNMKIKKSNPERRKSFRARHRCATAKDKTSARYWSCRMW